MTLNLHKVNTLIGAPYDANDFHCWTLIEELIPGAPKIDFVVEDITSSIKKIEEELNTQEDLFLYPDKIKNCDIVLFASKNFYNHVGIYYNNVIIHNDVYGVRTEPYKLMLNKYKKTKILRVKNDYSSRT